MAKLHTRALEHLKHLDIDPEDLLDVLADHPYRRLSSKDEVLLDSSYENTFKIKDCAGFTDSMRFRIGKLGEDWRVQWDKGLPRINLAACYRKETPAVTYSTGARAWLEIPEGLSPCFKNHTLDDSEVKMILAECEKKQKMSIGGHQTESYLASAMYNALLQGGYLK